MDEHQAAGGSQRSRVAFPYSALDSAIQVATAVHENHGTQCDIGQLAGVLDTTVASGKFRSMISAARLFGLIHTKSKTVSLTELGVAIVDPAKADAAKVNAFLAVPLYQQIFDKFDGQRLPPDLGLEAEIRSLGVTEKSVRRARQTLQRSASTAGFFRSGKNTLVRPPIEFGDETDLHHPQEDDSGTPHEVPERPDTSEAFTRDPVLSALWSKLPDNGEFPEPLRSKWLKMVEMALEMAYGPPEKIDGDSV